VKRERRRTLRSAGAVVVRRHADGPRVLVVHRRRQGDWTLPKGRVRTRELPAAAARREVLEEAGVECTAGVRILDATWQDVRGRRRVIRYWLMELAGERAFEPTDEIAEIAWLPLLDAAAILRGTRDRRALISAIAAYSAALGRPAAA
jgi:8-oxo-dGTP pyrophosphatase MutT (NUDIX family)